MWKGITVNRSLASEVGLEGAKAFPYNECRSLEKSFLASSKRMRLAKVLCARNRVSFKAHTRAFIRNKSRVTKQEVLNVQDKRSHHKCGVVCLGGEVSF